LASACRFIRRTATTPTEHLVKADRITLEGFFVDKVDIFIQGEGLSDIVVAASEPHHTIAAVLLGVTTIPTGDGLLLFLEDQASPISFDSIVEELLPLTAGAAEIICPLRIHLSRCRHVDVSVRFNGEVVARHFPPSATIARVHHWAARRAFGMTARDAAEHVLQIQGSTKRPDRDVHIGALTGGSGCCVAFDLVPRKRVEG
jgi:hypothetical protein